MSNELNNSNEITRLKQQIKSLEHRVIILNSDYNKLKLTIADLKKHTILNSKQLNVIKQSGYNAN